MQDTARGKPTRLGHLLYMRIMGERQKAKKVVFEVSNLANWQAVDVMNQNKEGNRMCAKCLAGF